MRRFDALHTRLFGRMRFLEIVNLAIGSDRAHVVETPICHPQSFDLSGFQNAGEHDEPVASISGAGSR
jgi:hypothetical protein